MVTGITAAAATPPSLKSSAITEKYLGFIPVLESPELLLADAQQLTEFTWLSNPGRALLETAQRPERIGRRWAERTGLAVDILDDCLNTELLDEITERHDWRDGYRRIASLCEGLASTSVAEEPAGQALFLRWAQRLPHCEPHEDWIDMFGRCALRKPFPEAVHDQQRRVRWDLPAPGRDTNQP